MKPRAIAQALAGLLAAGTLPAAPLPSAVDAALRAEGEAQVLVYLHEHRRAPVTLGREPRAAMIRRLRANLARSELLLRDLVGPEVRFVRASWIANALCLRGGRAPLETLARHPAVKRLVWDAPVAPPVARTVRASAGDGTPEWTWGLEALGVRRVREELGITGLDVRIGHIDSGVDAEHPDLAGKVIAWRDFSGEAAEPVDHHGHGTHTAATIAGGDASGTRVGVAPGAKLLVASAFRSNSTLLAAMEWMLDPDGDPATDDAPRVVSMSWRSLGSDQNPFYEALEAYRAAGIVPSFSAGNRGPQGGITTPKEHPYAFVSGATASGGAVAEFSSRGPARYRGREVAKPDLAAPGAAVYSALPGGGYGTKDGTSMAAPHTSGVIALMLEANPTLGPEEVRELLTGTALDAGTPGWDGSYGAGRLDAWAAVRGALARAAGAPGDPGESLARLDRFQELWRRLAFPG